MLWGLFQLLVRYVLKMPLEHWQVGSFLYDAVTSRDKEAGATLVKMQAEAVLCQNLFGAFLALIILDATDLASIPFLNACSTMCRTAALLVLGASCIHRTIAYVVRENRLYQIYFPSSAEKTESQTE